MRRRLGRRSNLAPRIPPSPPPPEGHQRGFAPVRASTEMRSQSAWWEKGVRPAPQKSVRVGGAPTSPERNNEQHTMPRVLGLCWFRPALFPVTQPHLRLRLVYSGPSESKHGYAKKNLPPVARVYQLRVKRPPQRYGPCSSVLVLSTGLVAVASSVRR